MPRERIYDSKALGLYGVEVVWSKEDAEVMLAMAEFADGKPVNILSLLLDVAALDRLLSVLRRARRTMAVEQAER